MSEKNRIKSLLKEAEVYRKQGLMEESKEKYLEIFEKIKSRKNSPQHEAFISSLQKRIQDVKNEIHEIDNAPEAPELSSEVQQLISNLFAFSEDKDIAAIEGAVALAEFGQYEGALTEFQNLLDKGISPMMVAKNMIRCHLSLASPKAAIHQFKMWMSAHTFSDKELGLLRTFYLEMLRSRRNRPEIMPGIPQDKDSSGPDKDVIDIPKIRPSSVVEAREKKEKFQDILEISSISIELGQAPEENRIVEFEITYQLGNTISFIVDADDGELTERLKPGVDISCVHCFSSVSTFEAGGVISEKKEITSGPKKGHYMFRMALYNP